MRQYLYSEDIEAMIAYCLDTEKEKFVSVERKLRPSMVGHTYDAADHLYLRMEGSKAQRYRFVKVFDRVDCPDHITFRMQLTVLGQEALRCAKKNYVWNALKERVDLQETMGEWGRAMEEEFFTKEWADSILATNDDWLAPLREKVMVEILKRPIEYGEYHNVDFWKGAS